MEDRITGPRNTVYHLATGLAAEPYCGRTSTRIVTLKPDVDEKKRWVAKKARIKKKNKRDGEIQSKTRERFCGNSLIVAGYNRKVIKYPLRPGIRQSTSFPFSLRRLRRNFHVLATSVGTTRGSRKKCAYVLGSLSRYLYSLRLEPRL